jgi:hypothetical protein
LPINLRSDRRRTPRLAADCADCTFVVRVFLQVELASVTYYIVHVEYMDYVYGASRVLTVFIL